MDNDRRGDYGCLGTIVTNIIFFILLMYLLNGCVSLFS